MSEQESLAGAIQAAVSDWAAAVDDSLLVNFVCSAEFIEADGSRSNAVVSAEDSSVSSVLGLAHYAVNLFEEVQRKDFISSLYGEEDE